jgi:hypothetical protein
LLNWTKGGWSVSVAKESDRGVTGFTEIKVIKALPKLWCPTDGKIDNPTDDELLQTRCKLIALASKPPSLRGAIASDAPRTWDEVLQYQRLHPHPSESSSSSGIHEASPLSVLLLSRKGCDVTQ